MTTTLTPASAHGRHYIETLGWKLCIIPHGAKGPVYPGWNTYGRAVIAAGQLPDAPHNIGLLHAFSGTAAIDIDDLDAARLWLKDRAVDLDGLLNHPDAVRIVSGRPGSAKLLFTMEAPRLSRRVIVGGKVILEFRSASASNTSAQDVLPPSTHPTGSVYRWAGGGVANGLPNALQPLPTVLGAIWDALGARAATPRHNPDPGTATRTVSDDEIESALNTIDPDCDRKKWVEVGMAIKLALGDNGFPLWNSWSAHGLKYKPREMAEQWVSFKNDHPNPVTLGTLFKHAFAAGWVPPIPSGVLAQFAAVSDPLRPTFKTPKQVIEGMFPSVPAIDLSACLPPEIAGYAAEVAASVGCDPIVPAMAGIAAVAGAADARIRLKYKREWSEPPIVRVFVIASSADKKSAASRPMLRPLKDIELEDTDKYRAALLVWKGIKTQHDTDMKAFVKFNESAEAKLPNGKPPEVIPLPEQPQPKQLLIEDSTSQGAAIVLGGRPYGLLLNMDESGDWLKKLSDPRGTENTSFWTRTYEGGHYVVNRAGDRAPGAAPRIPITNAAISIYGNIQPTILYKHLPALSADGGHARFIFAQPNTELISEGSTEDVPEWLSLAGEWEQTLRAVHGQPGAMVYELTPEARQLFEAWTRLAVQASKEYKQSGEGTFGESVVGKSPTHVLRLALVFHLASRHRAETMIPAATMATAIAFVKEFLLPQMEHLNRARTTHIDQWVAWKVIDWSNRGSFTESDLLRSFEKSGQFDPGERLLVKERIHDACADLAAMGWIALGSEMTGRATRCWMPSGGLAEWARRDREERKATRDGWTFRKKGARVEG